MAIDFGECFYLLVRVFRCKYRRYLCCFQKKKVRKTLVNVLIRFCFVLPFIYYALDNDAITITITNTNDDDRFYSSPMIIINSIMWNLLCFFFTFISGFTSYFVLQFENIYIHWDNIINPIWLNGMHSFLTMSVHIVHKLSCVSSFFCSPKISGCLSII